MKLHTTYSQSIKISIYILLVLVAYNSSAQVSNIYQPDGYADYAGTTGGGNSNPITVSNVTELKNAVGNTNSAVVIINGRIDMGGDVSIGSNKTLIGANTSSGLYGGAVLVKGTNYIFQNLTIGPHNDGDAMELSGATKVYITKCEFYDGADGNLDIVRASDYVTVSWCKFYYINQVDHRFSILIGNDDAATGDEGKLHVTMHHNWFAGRVDQRMPRVRYGYVHLYNNYYNSTGNLYCIGTGYKCHIRLENSHYKNVGEPWRNFDATTSGGQMGWQNITFEGCSQPNYIGNSYPVFSLPYNYTPDPTNQVASSVTACAGNVVCLTNDCNGDYGGSAYIDDCGVCVGGNTGKTACFYDCEGTLNGSAILDNCGVCTGGNTGNTPCSTIQFEDACTYEGSMDNNNDGFSGTGFFNFDNAIGTSISIKIYSDNNSLETIAVKYANGSGSDRPLSVTCNDEVITTTQSFLPTGSWTTWLEADLLLPLKRGANNLILSSLTSDGGPNLDQLNIPPYLSLGNCEDGLIQYPKLYFHSGWNLIGFPFVESKTIEDAFSDIWGNVLAIKNMDSYYDIASPSYLNTLKYVEWGKGYMVLISEDCVLEW